MRHPFLEFVTALTVGALAGLALAFVVFGADPLMAPTGSPLFATPLPCGGWYLGYDLNQNPADGPELHVVQDAHDTVMATIRFGEGEQGEFVEAYVRVQGGPPRRFATQAEFSRTYADPCQLIQSVKGLDGTRT